MVSVKLLIVVPLSFISMKLDLPILATIFRVVFVRSIALVNRELLSSWPMAPYILGFNWNIRSSRNVVFWHGLFLSSGFESLSILLE